MTRRPLTELNDRHHQILKLLVEGHKAAYIGRAINLRHSAIYDQMGLAARILGMTPEHTPSALVNEAFRRGMHRPPAAQWRCHVCLSPSQMFILWLIAQGKDNKSISRIINMPDVTARSATKQVLVKLDVTSRTDAVRVGWMTGLLNGETSPPPREWRCYPPGCTEHQSAVPQKSGRSREPAMF